MDWRLLECLKYWKLQMQAKYLIFRILNQLDRKYDAAEKDKKRGEYLRTGFGVQNFFSFENNNRKHFLPFFVLLGGGVMNLMHNPNRANNTDH
uniref:Uncharacterized protein n=1 Tax=Cucumis melo TaxID=3656 RepID=A0A9I9E8P2_CUCME